MSQDFLEILKYTLPSVVVFVTVYFLLKTYLSHMFKLKYKNNEEIVTKNPCISSCRHTKELLCFANAFHWIIYITDFTMLIWEYPNCATPCFIAVQQEYEHNVTQQIYISGKPVSIVENF
ncbi:MAG: hypothetical protein IPO37_13800 [Saprospiraceae bacterium]|nr:hypothetical protein [Saprospiraceae bacterium]